MASDGPDDAEDLLQEVYMRFIERPPCADTPGKLKHWFRTVMHHQWIENFRRPSPSRPGHADRVEVDVADMVGIPVSREFSDAEEED